MGEILLKPGRMQTSKLSGREIGIEKKESKKKLFRPKFLLEDFSLKPSLNDQSNSWLNVAFELWDFDSFYCQLWKFHQKLASVSNASVSTMLISCSTIFPLIDNWYEAFFQFLRNLIPAMFVNISSVFRNLHWVKKYQISTDNLPSNKLISNPHKSLRVWSFYFCGTHGMCVNEHEKL